MHSTRCVRFGAITIAILDVLVYFWAMAQIWICKYYLANKSEHDRCHFFSRGCGLRWFSAGLATTKLNLHVSFCTKSMTPRWGNTFLFRSSKQLPCLRLEGLFELTPVCHARRGSPKTPSKTANANLDSAFVEFELFSTDP